MKFVRLMMYSAVMVIAVPFSAAMADDIAGFCDCSEAVSGSKVEVCHYPPGKDSNRHTINIAQSAVNAHLAHGDVLGPCTDHEGKDTAPEAINGSPCTCADGSVGVWVHGEVKGPQSTREVHGQ